MKQNALTLSLVGGGIAFLCCFLPWIKIDIADLNLTISVSKESLTISGLHMLQAMETCPIRFSLLWCLLWSAFIPCIKKHLGKPESQH